jgi:hypothetical protein
MPGKYEMPKAVSDTGRLAVLGTFSGAEEQSFHLDSTEPGNSGITAYEEDQYVDVLWNSFIAMVILEELQADRKQATELVRSRLASQNPTFPPFVCSDEKWETLEPSAWESLVHHEFKARGVKDFEVVRVRIQKTRTALVDSRTAHAGTSWKAVGGRNRLYRGHFYGFRQNVMKRKRYLVYQKDEHTTVDLCDQDHFPIVSWAQRGAAGPIFAK